MKVHKLLKKVARKIYMKYVTIDSDVFIDYLRKKGVSVGNDVKFYSPSSNVVDLTRPYLITIGNKVKITRGVMILTHGFEWCVLREVYKRPFASAGKVEIGNNVFIGMNSIILKGVAIGDNVIIGAGSVVTKSIPPNCIVGGCPARVIGTLEEYYKKVVEREMTEATIIVQAIKERYGREPEPDDFSEHFYLFRERVRGGAHYDSVRRQVGDHMDEFLSSKPQFSNFEEFLSACRSKEPKK